MYIRYIYHNDKNENNDSIIRYVDITNGKIKKIEDIEDIELIINNNDDIYTSGNMEILKACFVCNKLNMFNNFDQSDIDLLNQKSKIYLNYLQTDTIFLYVRVCIFKTSTNSSLQDVELFAIDIDQFRLHPLGYTNILLPNNWDFKLFFKHFNSNNIKKKYNRINLLLNDVKQNFVII